MFGKNMKIKLSINMKFIIPIVIITLFVSSCKNYYTEPCEIEYKTVFEKTHFFNTIPDILKDEQFTINKADEERGYLIAERFVQIDKDSFQLNISIRFDQENKKFFITPSSAKLPRNEESIRFYSNKRMPTEMEPYFINALNRIEAFNLGKNFPNRQ